MADKKTALLHAAFGSFGFAMVEAVAAWVAPGPLDPVPSLLVSALSVLGTTTLIVFVAVVLSSIAPRSSGALALTLWAAVWGPHDARLVGWQRVGWLPAFSMAMMTPLAPGAVVLASVVGGAAGPWVRYRGEPRGLQAQDRASNAGVRRPDILLITVDTVRGDSRLLEDGQWGSRSSFSPIHGWTHFTEAIAPAPWTLPSMHSILTSLPVREHGGGLPALEGESRRFTGIYPFPYVLQQAGYETIAVVSNPHLAPEHGFADGFDKWFHSDESHEPLTLMFQYTRLKERFTGMVSEHRHGRDRRLVRKALDEIGQPRNGPRFVWVHLLGPHEYGRDPAEAIPGWEPGTTDKAVLAQSYAANIGAARAQVNRLTAAIPGWIVAITSDHGEAFGESGVWGHGKRLHDSELRVPLAIRRPGVEGGVIQEPVAVADLAHTLLAYAGRAGGFPGKNLHTARRDPIEVGGVRRDGTAFAARTKEGHYVGRKAGPVGPGVAVSDGTRAAIRALGYTN